MRVTPVKLWRRQKNTASLIGKRGRILLWSIIRVPAKSFTQQAPYPIVVIEFEKRERMILQLVDWREEDLRAGREVVIVLRRAQAEDTEGIIPYNIKCKPV